MFGATWVANEMTLSRGVKTAILKDLERSAIEVLPTKLGQQCAPMVINDFPENEPFVGK